MAFALLVLVASSLVAGGTVAAWWPVLRLQRRLWWGLPRPAALSDEPADLVPKKAPEAGGEETALVSTENELLRDIDAVRPIPARALLAGLALGMGGLALGLVGATWPQNSSAGVLGALAMLLGFLLCAMAVATPLLALHARWVLGKVPHALRLR